MMDSPGSAVGISNAPLVLLSFLQQNPSSVNEGFLSELDSLGRELSLTHCSSNNGSCCWSGHPTSNGPCLDLYDDGDGDLQTDGQLPYLIRGPPGGMQPLVQLERPGANFEEGAREIAAELRGIADQLEHDVVSQATNSLAQKLLNSPVNQWKNYLTLEVEWVVKHGLEIHLQQLPQERVILALAFRLVKGVCTQTPSLLRNLFNTAVQYISATVDRR